MHNDPLVFPITPPASDVAAWARDYEEASSGRLRVLADADGLWALRWSRTAGVWAEFPTGEAAYFTFAPLSTCLVSGEVQTEVFSSVDLDAWCQTFLAAMDDLFAPEMAEAIARVDEPAYAELVRCREQIAQVLSMRLVPVYAGGARKGDLEAARGVFEQALLDSLSRAYTISAVVQVPASIQVAGEASALRFFGAVTPGETYTTSAATLPLTSRCLTFMVSAVEPQRAATLRLASAYEVRYVEHESRWLELLTGALALPLQPLDVPVPLRSFPAAPVLIRQTASGASEPAVRDGNPVRDALWWDYTVELTVPGNGAQDELCVELETSELVISFARAHTESLLEVRARHADEWPTINGQRPTATAVALPVGYQCTYPFSGGESLTLRWPSLDLLARPSARSTFTVVRNAGLADELVYRTEPVTFASPALPRIEVDRLGPLPSGASLEDALAQVLRPVSRAGTVMLGVSYAYPVDDGLMATIPVLRADAVAEDELARQVTAWHVSSGLPTDGALLCLQVELDAVKLHRVEITVPPGWW